MTHSTAFHSLPDDNPVETYLNQNESADGRANPAKPSQTTPVADVGENASDGASVRLPASEDELKHATDARALTAQIKAMGGGRWHTDTIIDHLLMSERIKRMGSNS